MITIIFAVFAVICLGFIAYLLNQKWRLEYHVEGWREACYKEFSLRDIAENEVEDLQSRLAFAGKNYTEMKNKLNEEIRLLKTKINEKKKDKKATTKRKSRQTVQRTNKKKV